MFFSSWIKIWIIFAVSFMLLMHSSVNAKKYSIVARVSDTPPFSYQENGKWYGISVDLYRAMVEKAGFELKLIQEPWSRSFRSLKNGDIHLNSYLTRSQEREKYLHFIGPHTVDEIGIFIHKSFEQAKIDSIDDMIDLSSEFDLKFGLQHDYFISEEFQNRYNKEKALRASILAHVGLGDGLRMVGTRRLIGVIEPRSNGNYNIKINNLLYKDIIDSGFVIARTEVYFGVSKALPESIISALEQANQILLNERAYETILAKWIGRR